jgi:hypothetical protein
MYYTTDIEQIKLPKYLYDFLRSVVNQKMEEEQDSSQMQLYSQIKIPENYPNYNKTRDGRFSSCQEFAEYFTYLDFKANSFLMSPATYNNKKLLLRLQLLPQNELNANLRNIKFKRETYEEVINKEFTSNQEIILALLTNFHLNKYRKQQNRMDIEFLKKVLYKYKKETKDDDCQNLLIFEKDSELSTCFYAGLFDILSKENLDNVKQIIKLFPQLDIINNLTFQGHSLINHLFKNQIYYERESQLNKTKYQRFLNFLFDLTIRYSNNQPDLIKFQSTTYLTQPIYSEQLKKFIVKRAKDYYLGFNNAFECQKEFGFDQRTQFNIFATIIYNIKKATLNIEFKKQNLQLLLKMCEHLNEKYNTNKANIQQQKYFEFMMNGVLIDDFASQTYHASILESLQEIQTQGIEGAAIDNQHLKKLIQLMEFFHIKTKQELETEYEQRSQNKYQAKKRESSEEINAFAEYQSKIGEWKLNSPLSTEECHNILDHSDLQIPKKKAKIQTDTRKEVIEIEEKRLRPITSFVTSEIKKQIGIKINKELYDNRFTREEAFLRPKLYMGLGLKVRIQEDNHYFILTITENPAENSLIGRYNRDVEESKKINVGNKLKIKKDNINNMDTVLHYIRNNGINNNVIIEKQDNTELKNIVLSPVMHNMTQENKIKFYNWEKDKENLLQKYRIRNNSISFSQ